jgi:putative copper export protein
MRVMQSYAGVVGFIYFLQLILSFGVAIYLLFALIAPGVFGSMGSDRSGTLALLLDTVYIMLASAYIVMAHSSLGPSALQWRGRSTESAPVP